MCNWPSVHGCQQHDLCSWTERGDSARDLLPEKEGGIVFTFTALRKGHLGNGVYNAVYSTAIPQCCSLWWGCSMTEQNRVFTEDMTHADSAQGLNECVSVFGIKSHCVDSSTGICAERDSVLNFK